jgi:putative hemolysin
VLGHEIGHVEMEHSLHGLPPLLKGYLRLGAYIGDGAVVDHQWNSIDVCIILPSSVVHEKYVKHYERKTQKVIPAGEKMDTGQ